MINVAPPSVVDKLMHISLITESSFVSGAMPILAVLNFLNHHVVISNLRLENFD